MPIEIIIMYYILGNVLFCFMCFDEEINALEKHLEEVYTYTGHLIECRKNGELWGNFRQYYADKSDDYAEKTPDYAEISKINETVPSAFFSV